MNWYSCKIIRSDKADLSADEAWRERHEAAVAKDTAVRIARAEAYEADQAAKKAARAAAKGR